MQGILINGQFPGPQIESVTNDNLIISVFNSLDEPFLITWYVSHFLSFLLLPPLTVGGKKSAVTKRRRFFRHFLCSLVHIPFIVCASVKLAQLSQPTLIENFSLIFDFCCFNFYPCLYVLF